MHGIALSNNENGKFTEWVTLYNATQVEDIEIVVEAPSDAMKGDYFTIDLVWKDDHEKPGEV